MFQCPPLGKKQVLHRLPEADGPGTAGAGGVQGRRVPAAQGRLPLGPGTAAVFILQGHEQGVVRQPEGVFGTEISIGRGGRLQQTAAGFAQHLPPFAVEGAVVHPVRGAFPVDVRVFLPLQQAVGRQQVQVDEIGVARKGGEGLVGAVPVAGGTDGQDLPVSLSRRRKKIHKLPCCPAHGADAVGRRQAGQVHQHTACAHGEFLLSVKMVIGRSGTAHSPLPPAHRGPVHERRRRRPRCSG